MPYYVDIDVKKDEQCVDSDSELADVYKEGLPSTSRGTGANNTRRVSPHTLLHDRDSGIEADAETELIYTMVFGLLAKASGLPAEFYVQLPRISAESGTILTKLRRINILLASIQQQTQRDVYHYIAGYRQLVDLAIQLKSTYQSEETLFTVFLRFLRKGSELLTFNLLRNALPQSIVDGMRQMHQRLQETMTLYAAWRDGDVTTEQLIARLSASKLLPEVVQSVLSTCGKLIELQQRLPLTITSGKGFLDWLRAVLTDDKAAALLTSVLPTEQQAVLRTILHAAHQADEIPSNTAPWHAWLTWLQQQASLPFTQAPLTMLKDRLLPTDSYLYSLAEQVDILHTFLLRHPLPDQSALLSWIASVMMDEQTYQCFAIFLPESARETLASGATLIDIANRYPVGSPILQQLAWIAETYNTPSPELQHLLTQLPADAFIDRCRQYIRRYAINPSTLDLLLALADPHITLHQKTGLLFQYLTGYVQPKQVLSAVIRRYVPGGELFVGIWTWYQQLPEQWTWAGALEQLATSLETAWPEQAAVARSLLNCTWQEVCRKALALMTTCSPEVKWIYLRYLELGMLWAAKELLMSSKETCSAEKLQHLSAAVKDYCKAHGLSYPLWLPTLLGELRLLLDLRPAITQLSRNRGWLAWLNGLFAVLEQHPRAAQLRQNLEQSIQDSLLAMLGENVSDVALEAMQIIASKMDKPLPNELDKFAPHADLAEECATLPSASSWRRSQSRQSRHHT